MNKKFFAALASATMAFTASGSIAVFADDFVEKSNVVEPGDVKPVETEVVFNEANFGALVKLDQDKFVGYAGSSDTLKKGKTVKTADLAKVKSITFTSDFKGTIKGLEYFTGLETFDDSAITAGEIKNESLDFAANTSLTEIKVTKAAGLKEITLPEADADEVYHLDSLTLTNTKLNALDLTKQEALTTLEVTNADFASLDLATQKELETLTLTNTNLTALDLSAQKELAVTVTGNKNLKDIVLNNGKKGKPVTLTSLDLQNNALETVNLDHIAVTGTLNLNGTHIGALDLSTTKVATGNLTLDTQKFYVSENAANVMLTEAFSDLEVWNV